MNELIRFLSGPIPGGIFLLAIVILAANLVFIFFRSSGLIEPSKSRKFRLIATVALLLIYIGLWTALRPPRPQIRVIVLPAMTSGQPFQLNESAVEFPELVRQSAFGRLKGRYMLHRWPWLAQTIGPDSLNYYDMWSVIARRMQPGFILQPLIKQDSLIGNLTVSPAGESIRFSVPAAAGWHGLLEEVNQTAGLFESVSAPEHYPDQIYLKALAAFQFEDYQTVASLMKSDTSVAGRVLKAAALVQQGLQKKIDRQKARYVDITIQPFKEARRILYSLVNQRRETAEAAFWIGRMALRKEDYNKADLFLKRALVEDPLNCRIHYALSFLMSYRLEELGYNDRAQILEKAVAIDPGFRNAVYELAMEYYASGTGTQTGTGTTMALNTLRHFLNIKSGDPQILSLLGSIYLKIQQYDQAGRVFSELQERFPKDANAYYNLGIVHYMKKNKEQALDYFFKAIEMDNTADAYLYVAIIYHEQGQLQKALKYYRQRVRLKSGDDDTYAKEAMKGVRRVLSELAEQDSVTTDAEQD